MRKYRLVAKKGEGTFSEVLKAQNVKDGRYHAIKCMKNRFESIDQVNNLREIQALRRLSPHEHIISLEEVLYDQPTGRLALVFELMDANLYELIRGRRHYLNPQLIKSYMWQLLKSLDHMHKKGIFHRDIKPENILIESSSDIGRGLKLADFGSCRGIYSKQPYTEYISTRWYRAPECLLTDGYYGPEMDLWGAGCVMFEITSLYPLFPGSNETDQITRIHKVLGTPTAEVLQKFKSKGANHISFDFPMYKGVGFPQLIPHASADAIDLLVKLLKYDAAERITAREAMRHAYFRDIRESEVKRMAGGTVSGVDGVGKAGNESNSNASVVSNSNQSKVNGGSNAPPKQQQIVQQQGKGLPNINGSGVNLDQQSNKPGGYSSTDIYQHQPVVIKPSQTIKANNYQGSGMSVSGYQAGVGAGGGMSAQTNMSSLPPIGIGNAPGQNMNNNPLMKGQLYSQNQNPNADPKAGLRAYQPSNQQKKRKKYRSGMNYGQGQKSGQNTEQVMKAYGISQKAIGTDNKIPQQQQQQQVAQGNPLSGPNANTYNSHPNRHYVVQQAKKN